MTRALWLVSAISAFISVLFSCTRQKIIGRIWCEKNIAELCYKGIHNTPPKAIEELCHEKMAELLEAMKQSCNEKKDEPLEAVKELCHEKMDEFLEAIKHLRHQKKDESPSASCKDLSVPSLAVVIAFSLVSWFLQGAIWTYVIGLGMYLGVMWRNSVYGDGEYFANRNIFIVFLVWTIMCVCVYSLVHAFLFHQQMEFRRRRWHKLCEQYEGTCICENGTKEPRTQDLEKN